ncbi:MAG: cyclase family protein [Halieaceae bacterium]|jgi:kynurenine formamidase|nr:cyclase family protein [Halieaceae bacterium]
MSNAVLGELVRGLAAGNVRLVDLTETLRPEYPTIQLPPEFGQAWGFSKETISQYDEKGPAWRWSNFSMSEHTGTHLDAPAHWVTGKDLPGATVDTMPLQQMIAPVCVIDCSAQVAKDRGFILTREFLLEWEQAHGRIPAGSWVFLRSDWRKVADPDNYTNVQADGAHSPGPDKEAVLWMIQERDVLGFGTECVGTDAGQAYAMDPPYPCHHFMHGNGRLGLQCMTNLDLLPATGAVVIATPLKIIDGSGSPLRVVALVAG